MSRRGDLLDVGTGIALAGFCAGLTPFTRVTQPAVRPLDAGAYVLLVVAGGSISLHRRKSVWAFVVSVAAATTFLAIGFPGWPIYVAAVGGLASLAAGVKGQVWVPLAAAGGVALAVAAGRPEGWQPGRIVGVFVVWCALGLLLREAAIQRTRRADAEARHRVVEERLRIARDLHDVLSHSLATISLQAGVGLHMIDSAPGQAREALTSIRTVSSEALAQARRALSAVREPGTAEQLAGEARLSDVDALVARVQSTGLMVQLDREQIVCAPAVEAAAYRVVQESLTNVMRHAGSGARASVRIRGGSNGLDVQVCDDGRGVVGLAPPGHGLRGMGERVRGLGGEFSAGPRAEGGFSVRATFPPDDWP